MATAEIHITIDAEAGQYLATTPHAPKLEGRSTNEALAVNELIRQIRSYRQQYESRGEAVPWQPGEGAENSRDRIVKHLTGVAPTNTVQPTKEEHEHTEGEE